MTTATLCATAGCMGASMASSAGFAKDALQVSSRTEWNRRHWAGRAS
jgi:hypothetical protein